MKTLRSCEFLLQAVKVQREKENIPKQKQFCTSMKIHIF